VPKEIDPRVESWLIEGKTQKEIASLLGVSQPTVSRIVKLLKMSFKQPPTLPDSASMTISKTPESSAPLHTDVYGVTKFGLERL
jgi:hypothetical protein